LTSFISVGTLLLSFQTHRSNKHDHVQHQLDQLALQHQEFINAASTAKEERLQATRRTQQLHQAQQAVEAHKW
jgi:hypothetical protein